MGDLDVAYDADRFAEMVLHVAVRLQDDRAGGATKLNKILFFAEFTHLRRHKHVISGCEFQKLPHGPAPRQLLPVRRRLIESGAAELVEEDFLGRPQHRLIPSRAANLDVFTDEEMQTIEDVLTQLADMTFWSGPLAAALIGFRDFDNLLFDRRPDHPAAHQTQHRVHSGTEAGGGPRTSTRSMPGCSPTASATAQEAACRPRRCATSTSTQHGSPSASSSSRQRMATGHSHTDSYVFAKPDGSPIHPDLISQTFERLLAKLDLPRVRLHDLRHTHATILLQQGINPKVVSERLGHASVSFTMDVYKHVLPGMQAQAAATFGTAIFGDG